MRYLAVGHGRGKWRSKKQVANCVQVDKEVNSLKAAMEQSKNDTVKYVLGLMFALLTAGLGAARLVLH